MTKTKQHRLTITVKGMYCSWCKDKIAGCIKKFPGIISVKMDIDKHKVTIISRKKIEREDVSGLLRCAGYKPENHNRNIRRIK